MTPQVYKHLGLTNSEYVAVHSWVKRHFGKANKCDNCGQLDAVRYEWSNISKKYLRKRSDWKMLCTTCHRKADYTDKQRQSISSRSSKLVRQVVPNGANNIYTSITLASKMTGVSRTGICNVLAGRAATAGGFVWERA